MRAPSVVASRPEVDDSSITVIKGAGRARLSCWTGQRADLAANVMLLLLHSLVST